jgi:hypothetical protein
LLLLVAQLRVELLGDSFFPNPRAAILATSGGASQYLMPKQFDTGSTLRCFIKPLSGLHG